MIHVAEASEAKGRVVVQACSARPSPVALEAAVWLASAFQSEIESLYIEDEQLIEMARYPFAREISLSGRASRALTCEDIEREFRYASQAFHAMLESLARAAEVSVRSRVVRDETVRALSAVCAASGPWNAVALAEPFTSPGCPPLHVLFQGVRDATGLLIVGPNAQRTSGPVVVALEDAEQLAAMLAAADRLVAVRPADILLCLLATDETELDALESMARLVLAERDTARIAGRALALGAEAAAAEALRRLSPGLVIGRFGGVLVPHDGDLRPLAIGLECPLLLMR
jgi:hypothetical protein